LDAAGSPAVSDTPQIKRMTPKDHAFADMLIHRLAALPANDSFRLLINYLKYLETGDPVLATAYVQALKKQFIQTHDQVRVDMFEGDENLCEMKDGVTIQCIFSLTDEYFKPRVLRGEAPALEIFLVQRQASAVDGAEAEEQEQFWDEARPDDRFPVVMERLRKKHSDILITK